MIVAVAMCYHGERASTYQGYLDWLVMRIRIAAHLEHALLLRVVHDNRAESRGLRVEHLIATSNATQQIHPRQQHICRGMTAVQQYTNR